MEGLSPMTNVYPRESVEFQPVLVTQDGVAITTGVEFAVIKPTARPTDADWFAATLLQGATGFLTGTYGVGIWKVWAQVTDSPEIPVIDCGTFQVS
jgi:hypothetical protein